MVSKTKQNETKQNKTKQNKTKQKQNKSKNKNFYKNIKIFYCNIIQLLLSIVNTISSGCPFICLKSYVLMYGFK